jgi:hypothetical protein
MKQKELIEHLHSREKALMNELDAIKTLLGVYTSDDTNEEVAKISDSMIPPKGKMSWENYAVLVLRKIGGTARASKVTDAVIKANPGIGKNTIKSAIRAKLSIKYREGVISAIKGDSKKDGYVYEIKDTTMIRTK